MDDRIYLQYQPNEQTLEWISHLAQSLEALDTSAQVLPIAKMHLTLIHFGIADNVYTELLESVPGLGRDIFDSALDEFIKQAERAMPQQTSLQSIGYTLFGPTKNVLVLQLQPSQEIIDAHAHALNCLRRFFMQVDVTDPDAFMVQSPNFQFALHYSPHISLFRKWSAALLDIESLQETLLFTKLPPRYDLNNGRLP